MREFKLETHRSAIPLEAFNTFDDPVQDEVEDEDYQRIKIASETAREIGRVEGTFREAIDMLGSETSREAQIAAYRGFPKIQQGIIDGQGDGTESEITPENGNKKQPVPDNVTDIGKLAARSAA